LVEERVKRRLAAIVRADVAGYSRLIGADAKADAFCLWQRRVPGLQLPSPLHSDGATGGIDEEKTLAALKAHRRELIDPLIDQHADATSRLAATVC
jgi:hypothetical protein